MITDPNFTREVSGFVYKYDENEIPSSLSGANLTFTLCDRTDTSSKLGNYFVSLNLPPFEEDLPKYSSLSVLYPELLQLNVDQIVLIKIPNTAYTEYIDARSVELNVPVTGFSTSSIKLFSSTYTGTDYAMKQGETSPLLGDNIAYLFSDSINLPYTGLTFDETGFVQDHSSIKSWRPNSKGFYDRPSAVSYLEVQGSNDTINTDRRMAIYKSVFVDGLFNDYRGQAIGFYQTRGFGGQLSFFVEPDRNIFKNGDSVTIDMFDHRTNPSYSGNATIVNVYKNQTSAVPMQYAPSQALGPWDLIRVNRTFASPTPNQQAGTLYISGGTYYNYDIPVGFVVLDKGLVVITHRDIVRSMDWTSGFMPDGNPSAGNIGPGTTDIYFTAVNKTIYGDTEPVADLKFTAIDTVFKMRATCNCLLGEFFISNNSTWYRDTVNDPLSQDEPVSITEIGLYNEMNELIGVAKFSEPVIKGGYELFTFEVDINL